MPINFSQPEPMAPAITAGAAAAEFAAKTFPTIAQIYENAARLRASGGGGGGHGGVVQGGGPIQVLSRDDQGALAQVEQQANREQRALDLGFEAQQDPVAGHIRQQQQFKMQQQQQAQQAQSQQLAMLNGPPVSRGQPQIPQAPEPTTWAPDDESALAGTIQAIDGVRTQYNNGVIPLPAYQQMMEPLQAYRSQLLAKQRKAEDDKDQQQQQKQMKAVANQDSLAGVRSAHLNKWMPTPFDEIPGMPKSNWKGFDQHGVPIDGNEKIREHFANHYWDAEKQGNLKKMELDVKQTESEEKHYGEDRKLAVDELLKTKGKDSTGKQITPSEEEIHALAMNFGQKRIDAREERGLEKNANPQVRAAYVDHIDSIPKADGKPDWNQGSNTQLAQLGKFLSDPKAVGVTKKEAQAGIDKIRKILQDRITPRPVVSPPPPLTAIKPDLSTYQRPASSGAFFSDTAAGSY